MKNVLAKIVGFTIGYYEWVKAGRPKRDPEWVAELWSICSNCPHYDSALFTPFGRGGCVLCGCRVSPNPDLEFNKLIWPTESCPDLPPRWEASIDKNPD